MPDPTPSADARESDADFVGRMSSDRYLTDGTVRYEIDANHRRYEFDRLLGIARRAVAPASTDPASRSKGGDATSEGQNFLTSKDTPREAAYSPAAGGPHSGGAPSLMSAEELDGFEARARAATPGPWKVDYVELDWGHPGGPDTKLVTFVKDEDEHYIVVDEEPNAIDGEPSPNAAHIAGLDPQTVLRLVAQVRLALGQAEDWPAGSWTVEKIDDDGGIEQAFFVGPDADKRAHWYAIQTGSQHVPCRNGRVPAAPSRASEADVTDDMAGAALEAFHEIEGRRDVSEIESMRTAVRAGLAAMPDRDPAGRVRGLTEAAEIARERGNFWLADGDDGKEGEPVAPSCPMCGSTMTQDELRGDWYCDFSGPHHDDANAAPIAIRPEPAGEVEHPTPREIAEKIVFLAVNDSDETWVREKWKPEIDAGEVLVRAALARRPAPPDADPPGNREMRRLAEGGGR